LLRQRRNRAFHANLMEQDDVASDDTEPGNDALARR
jgi:hypothetical protein